VADVGEVERALADAIKKRILEGSGKLSKGTTVDGVVQVTFLSVTGDAYTTGAVGVEVEVGRRGGAQVAQCHRRIAEARGDQRMVLVGPDHMADVPPAIRLRDGSGRPEPGRLQQSVRLIEYLLCGGTVERLQRMIGARISFSGTTDSQ
jgi:hypothetical protein